MVSMNIQRAKTSNFAKFRSRAKLIGKLETIRKTAAYKKEGDETMYTSENLKRRDELKNHPKIEKVIRSFWNVLDLAKDRDGCISRKLYLEMHGKLQRAIVDDFDEKDAMNEATSDWHEDVGGATKMDFQKWKSPKTT